MATFKEYLTDNVHYESLIETVAVEDLEVLAEGLAEIETELNEFLGLGKAAKFLKDRAEKKAVDNQGKAYDKERSANEKASKLKKEQEEKAAKEKADREAKADKSKASKDAKTEDKKEMADRLGKMSASADKKVTAAKDAVVSAAKDKVNTAVVGAKLAAKDISDKKDAIKDSFLKVSDEAKTIFKKFFKDTKNVSEDQKKTLGEVEGIFTKLTEGKTVSGVEAIKILATVLAGSPEANAVPGFKAYTKQLERLRALPGISSYKFSVKVNA